MRNRKQNDFTKATYVPHGFTLTFENNSYDEIDGLIIELRKVHLKTMLGMQKLSKCDMFKLFMTWNIEKQKSSGIFGDLIFGTFDYMRAELEIVNKGEQFWVNSFDNSKIDCMIIPSALKNDQEEVFDGVQSKSDINSSIAHTNSQRGGGVSGPLDSLNTFRNSRTAGTSNK
jgi:hypothetical protein